MKKWFTLMAACLTCLFAVSVNGDAPELQEIEVTARGIGTSPELALKDALAQAVLQAAGALVDSETLMENDEIVNDKVLTYSDGIVKKFEKLQEPKQNKQGLWSVNIKAVVQQNLLKEKLSEAKLITAKVDNAQDFWAEIITESKKREDAIPIIEKVLDRIDVMDYIQFALCDRNGNQGPAAKLEIKKIGDDRVSVAIPVIVAVDFKRFQEEVAFPLVQVLDNLCLAKQTQIRNCAETYYRKIELCGEYKWRGEFSPDSNLPKIKVANRISYAPEDLYSDKKNRKNSGVLKLNISKRYNPESQKFISFALPVDLRRIWQKLQKNSRSSALVLSLLDKSGDEIVINQISLCGTPIFLDDNTISPEIDSGARSLGIGTIILLTAELSVDDLKDLASFKVELQTPAKGK